MPEVCRFYGIVITVYYNDHGPAHLHARYGDSQAVIGIDSLTVLQGHLPPRARGLVVEWASLRQAELWAAWFAARSGEPISRIAPLE